MPNIVLIDDHCMVLDSLSIIIESDKRNKVIEKFSDCQSAIEYINSNSGQIDLVITDLRMPEESGIAVLEVVQKKHPRLKSMVLTQFSGDHYIINCVKLGINGYVLKNCEAQVLLEAIDQIVQGGFYLCNKSNLIFVESSRKQATKQHLTDREKNIVKLISKGKASDEIALSLNISKHTVAYHRKNIFDKLKMDSVAELTRYAIQSGILYFDPS